mgnify:CR=1 FL=1|tara:strand:- start:599 stop:1315 length:717 start_codon:yes stop_codon:yes gene_type:complete
MTKFLIKTTLFLFSMSLSNLESKTMDGLELKNLIDNWLNESGQISNVKILEQMKYPDCDDSNMIINDISGSFKLIKVTCTGPHTWSFIVRNKINSKIKRTANPKNSNQIEVLALRNPKRSGTIITEEDIIVIKKNISRANNGIVTDKKDLIGKKLSKSISSNRPIHYSNIQKDWMIEKNSVVIIENNLNNTVIIKDQGLALENADYMQKIKVKNLKSGKIIWGFAENAKKIVLNTKQN